MLGRLSERARRHRLISASLATTVISTVTATALVLLVGSIQDSGSTERGGSDGGPPSPELLAVLIRSPYTPVRLSLNSPALSELRQDTKLARATPFKISLSESLRFMIAQCPFWVGSRMDRHRFSPKEVLQRAYVGSPPSTSRRTYAWALSPRPVLRMPPWVRPRFPSNCLNFNRVEALDDPKRVTSAL